jgi:hypothetical protein
MRQLYIILASVGWAWLLLVGGYLLGRFSPALPEEKGKGDDQTHEQ